jgi:copper resistance protein C
VNTLDSFSHRIRTTILIWLVTAASLDAHAILTDSSPAAHEIVAGPNVVIKLRFNSRIDGAHSRLYVDDAGTIYPVAMSPQPMPDTLVGEAKNLSPGEHRLRWQVLAIDGHITRGEFPFTVH